MVFKRMEMYLALLLELKDNGLLYNTEWLLLGYKATPQDTFKL